MIWILVCAAVAVVGLAVASLRILREYQRGVVFASVGCCPCVDPAPSA